MLITICGVGIVGSGISQKYQVEHPRIFLEIDSDTLTNQEFQKQKKEIDKMERQVRIQQFILLGIVMISIVSGTVLLKNRVRLIKA